MSATSWKTKSGGLLNMGMNHGQGQAAKTTVFENF